MIGSVKHVLRGLALLALAGLAFGLLRPEVGSVPVFGGGDKKTEKDKKDPPKVPDKKKEIPKDKTKPLLELKGHKDWINSAAFSNDGKFLITASRDGTVKIWDLKAGKDISTLELPKKEKEKEKKKIDIKAAVLTPDAKQAISTAGGLFDKKKQTWEGEIKFWDVEKGKEVKALKGHTGEILAVTLSPKGNLLATASADTTVILWDLKDGKAVQTLKGHKTKVNNIAFNKDGTQIATAASLPIPKDPKTFKPAEEVMVKIWNVADGKEVQSFKGAERDISSVAFSPDGKHLAAGSWDGKIYIWDMTGKEFKKITADEGVLSIDFSGDGKSIAASGWEDTTKVWDVESGKELFYRNGHEKSVTAVLFSPDNQRLVTVGIDSVVRVWEVPAKK